MSATEEATAPKPAEEEKMPELEPVAEKKEEAAPKKDAHGHDHAHDHAHDHDHHHHGEGEKEGEHKQSKAEKKARKAAKSLGLRPVPNCTAINVRSNRTTFFSIFQPEVFRVGNTNNYIVFGQLRTEDPNLRAQEEAAKQFSTTPAQQPAVNQQDLSNLVQQITKEEKPEPEKAEEKKAEEDDGEVDMTGLNPDEVDIVIKQANVTKKKAVEALRANDGDYIQAIISLTN